MHAHTHIWVALPSHTGSFPHDLIQCPFEVMCVSNTLLFSAQSITVGDTQTQEL